MTDICERLQAVCDKVTGNRPSDVNLGMHIPADQHRDLDLIVMAAKTEIKRLRKIAIQYGAMDLSPCDVCGYNGPGFFQPKTHPCAAIFHASSKGDEK